MSLKSIVKKALPAKVARAIGASRVQGRERLLSRLPIQDAFDEVYKKKMWQQGGSRSGLGSEGLLAERYIDLVSAYAARHGLRTAVDAGCGDFSIGSRLAPRFDKYSAFDVSPFIIESNRKRYAHLGARNVTFGVADMTSAEFPAADLILIRQVLQHLTNAQITLILDNLEKSRWRRALITEDVHDPRNNQTCNLDLPCHTVRTRVSLSSGVFIDREPFARAARRIAILEESSTPPGSGPQSGLIVFELSRDSGPN